MIINIPQLTVVTKWCRRLTCVLLFLGPITSTLYGQLYTDWKFLPQSNHFRSPYAGKLEPRIGTSWQTSNRKLRLDIGSTIDLYGTSYTESLDVLPLNEGDRGHTIDLTFGTDFFTWTRLRAAGSFKFPVEAVDYYFGVNASVSQSLTMIGKQSNERVTMPEYGLRLRVAHISAHLVDGDPSFTNSQSHYITYSREFVDLCLAFDVSGAIFDKAQAHDPHVQVHAGSLWMFHSIPDSLGRINPFIGCDIMCWPFRKTDLTILAGYELRLNTELAKIGENQARVGVKLGRPDTRGILFEAGYYSGRSQYGQHFAEREKYYSLGFALDF